MLTIGPVVRLRWTATVQPAQVPPGVGWISFRPGWESMQKGTRSYIVEGKGAASSYCSCSHGAGRRLSRGQARRTLDLDGLREQMQGKAWNDDQADALLDEDPRSYKDIDQVMADQDDLVTVRHTLSQVLNYKGA